MAFCGVQPIKYTSQNIQTNISAFFIVSKAASVLCRFLADSYFEYSKEVCYLELAEGSFTNYVLRRKRGLGDKILNKYHKLY